KWEEVEGDGRVTSPIFIVPESMLSASGPPPLKELYVIVNSKLGPEFKLTDRTIAGVLGRSIAVALTSALRAQVALIKVGAQRHGIALRIARVDDAFNHPSRGPFDGQYMKALYEIAAAARRSATALAAH